MIKSDAPAIKAAGLGRRFGRYWALAHVDLELPAGRSLLLAGANGSGKTTFLRIVAGLHRPTRGTLQIFGRDAREEREACRQQLTLVSHSAYLYARLTALESLRTWARLLGQPSRDADLMPLLEEVGLGNHHDQAVGGFSAGMRKRLTLLRARLEEPRMVLLDEPFAALDVPGQKLVKDWVQRFRDDGISVVLASHQLQQAAELCDDAVVLHKGQIAWRGGAEKVVGAFEAVTTDLGGTDLGGEEVA